MAWWSHPRVAALGARGHALAPPLRSPATPLRRIGQTTTAYRVAACPGPWPASVLAGAGRSAPHALPPAPDRPAASPGPSPPPGACRRPPGCRTQRQKDRSSLRVRTWSPTVLLIQPIHAYLPSGRALALRSLHWYPGLIRRRAAHLPAVGIPGIRKYMTPASALMSATPTPICSTIGAAVPTWEWAECAENSRTVMPHRRGG